ncbi:uncharacterized protein LOC142587023 isoform X2 [Dermacentor variabilis]|uniref:uncharacterized protein LOC142587023 isoform X2 n=1 Tax=Dermacentor variabilis TaxID=34621 RepID=UPI003F5C024A
MGHIGNHCNATFTRDGDSANYNAMNVSCIDQDDNPPVTRRTQEKIVFQAYEAHQPDHSEFAVRYPKYFLFICALFKITFLEGTQRHFSQSSTPQKDKPEAPADYVLRVWIDGDHKSTSCLKEMEKKSKEAGKNINECPLTGSSRGKKS